MTMRVRTNSPDPRIHVVQTTFGMGIGGMERMIMDLCRYTDPQRFRFTVCCLSVRGPLADQLDAEGVPVVFCENQTRLGKYLRALELTRILCREQPDILHTHNTTAFVDGLIAAKLARVPIVVHTDHCKNYPIELRWTIAEHVASRFVDRVVAVSHHTRSDLIRHEWIPVRKLTVIHNGIDPRLTRNTPVEALRRELAIPSDHLVIGTVGRLETQKGLDLFLSAIHLLGRDHPNVTFLIVGGGSQEADLKDLARRLGVAERVIFTGWRSDAVDLLQLLDCFVSTSNFEGLPMVLLEAMAFAKPIVATAVGGVPELVEPEFNGLTVGERNPRLVAEALSRLIRDEAFRRRLGENSRVRYKERFTARAMADAYQQLYEGHLHAKRVSAV